MITKEQRKVINDRLEFIAEKSGGVLRPDDVVDDALQPESPLHALPIWNDWDQKRAAREHWLETARELIRQVRLVVTTDKTTLSAPFYVRDPDADPDKQGYVAITSVRTDEDRARSALVAEFERVASVLRRAKDIAAALGMEDEIVKLISGVLHLRERVAPKRAGPGPEEARVQ